MKDKISLGSRDLSNNHKGEIKSTCHNSQVSSIVLCQDEDLSSASNHSSICFDSFEGKKYLSSNESVSSIHPTISTHVDVQFNTFMKNQVNKVSGSYLSGEDQESINLLEKFAVENKNSKLNFKKTNNYQVSNSLFASEEIFWKEQVKIKRSIKL